MKESNEEFEGTFTIRTTEVIPMYNTCSGTDIVVCVHVRIFYLYLSSLAKCGTEIYVMAFTSDIKDAGSKHYANMSVKLTTDEIKQVSRCVSVVAAWLATREISGSLRFPHSILEPTSASGNVTLKRLLSTMGVGMVGVLSPLLP